jgi:hypothetical protein
VFNLSIQTDNRLTPKPLLVPSGGNIYDLKKKVKEEAKHELNWLAAVELKVFAEGNPFNESDGLIKKVELGSMLDMSVVVTPGSRVFVLLPDSTSRPRRTT